MQYKNAAQTAFATGMIGLGVFGLINGDFMGAWQSVPKWVPGREALAYVCAAIMLVCGIGLLAKRTEVLAARVLFPYLALVVLLVKLPVIVKHPLVEVAYQSLGEMLVIFAGGWVLFAGDTRPLRPAQVVFGLALIPLGLAHFFYLNMTAPLIPGWIPFHTFWAYFTGAAQVAAGLGVLFGILPALAAAMDAALLTVFTVVIWIPLLLATPASMPTWSEFTASWAVTAGAWVVAASFTDKKPATGT